MKKLLSLLCISAITLTLVGCGNSGSKSNNKNYVNLAKEVDVISMDTTYATDGMSLETISATTEGLETMDKDGNIVPALAKDYKVSDDGLTYTFTLRDAKWSNDTPVTANDFVYAWNTAIKNDACEYAYLFTKDGACIKNADEILDGKDMDLDVTAKDDHTLVVKLSKKCPYFLSLMTFPVFFPINEDFHKEQGDKYALTPDNLLACGPYTLTSWEKGKGLVLDKNEKYWDKDNVKVDGIKFNIVAEASTSALDFESGNTDYTKLNSTLVDKYKDSDEYASFLEGYLWYLQFNYNNKALQNVNVRKAIATVIDRKDLVENVLKDGSIAKGGFVPSDFTNGPDGKDYVETGKEYYNLQGKEALNEAKKYWDQAKKELGTSEISLRLLYEPSDPAKPTAEFIQSQLQQLDGLNLEMVSLEKESRIEKQKQHDFDIALTRWGPDYADPTTYLNLMYANNDYNYGKYNNPKYDALLKQAENAKSPQERWDLLHKAEELLMEDTPVAGLFQVGGASLVRKGVTGIEAHSSGVPYLYKNLTKESK